MPDHEDTNRNGQRKSRRIAGLLPEKSQGSPAKRGRRTPRNQMGGQLSTRSSQARPASEPTVRQSKKRKAQLPNTAQPRRSRFRRHKVGDCNSQQNSSCQSRILGEVATATTPTSAQTSGNSRRNRFTGRLSFSNQNASDGTVDAVSRRTRSNGRVSAVEERVSDTGNNSRTDSAARNRFGPVRPGLRRGRRYSNSQSQSSSSRAASNSSRRDSRSQNAESDETAPRRSNVDDCLRELDVSSTVDEAANDAAPQPVNGSVTHGQVRPIRTRTIPSVSIPIRGQAYCECYPDGGQRETACQCGEEDTDFAWLWDPENRSSACDVADDGRLAKFHLNYSCGTAACRGTKPMKDQQYFWEIKMTTPVYGTDMMVGVGTKEVNLNGHTQQFISLLGQDSESWGYSYTGKFYHAGHPKPYGSNFGQGSIIGVHMDMWRGTLAFYKNRKFMGLATKGLYGKMLYPMVSSTAARSAMKLIKARTCETTLQFFCCQVLRRSIPKHMGVVEVLEFPPGLKVFLDNNYGWLLNSVEPYACFDRL